MKKFKITAMLLAAMLLVTLSGGAFAAFTDIPGNHMYKTAIDYCAEMGFVNGTSATTFEPDATLTRAQFAAIWARSLQFNDRKHPFNDITKLNLYYDVPMIVLYSKGILNGTSDTTVSPLKSITREQLAVITERTHNLGVEFADDYLSYNDAQNIGEWARDGVNACINAGVFEGLFDGDSFQPAKPVTRAELCKLVYNLNSHPYDIVIDDEIEGGTVTANVTKARAGSTIIVTVTPDENMQLVEGSLMYDDVAITDGRFEMPAHDVTITAEFEEIPEPEVKELLSIVVATEPTKTEYEVGEEFNVAGLTLTATYADESTETITEGFVTTPENGSLLETTGDVNVQVSYTENEVEKTAEFSITVAEATGGDE